MLEIAYIFPGQGAQYVGMGEDFYLRYPQSKEVFDQASKILAFDLSQLCFRGSPEELTKTGNCQLAIFTASIAILRALEAEQPAITVRYAAGLSLGEYTALVAASALSFEQGLKLVKIRAESMEEAAQQNPGGMVSIIGLPIEMVEEICEKSKTEIANLNCPGQIVISGSFPALEKAKQKAQQAGAKKVISLNVRGAFHSSLMAPASQRLTEGLAKAEICPSKIAVVNNVTAQQEYSPQEIKDNLTQQLVSRTRWEDSVRFIISGGVKNFLEIGPGRILRGLLRKIDPELKVYNIEQVSDLEKFIPIPESHGHARGR